jgi:two-component system, sensor histidine kinase and response regulator
MSSLTTIDVTPLRETSRDAPRKGTLLIVDDEEGPRQSLQIVFKNDYKILTASDGPTAVALAQANRIDVAVLDIRMAGMSGIEVLERLKYVDPDIEVVMLTAFETTDTIRQALRLQACDYLNKPFDVATMRNTVASAMRRRSLKGELTKDTEQLQLLLKELQNQKIEGQMAQSRGDIYASIIHDLNGPLTVIAGFMQLIRQRVDGVDHLHGVDLDFVKERLQTVSRQVGNCTEISRRYLSFLRQQADEGPKIGANQLLQDLQHLLRVHPSRGHHELAVLPLNEDIAVRMNGTDFIQVLQNLVVNAFQCAPQPHTVEVSGCVHENGVPLESLRDTDEARLLNVESFSNQPPVLAMRVRDTGPGIPPGVLPKIFQAYYTTKGPRNGTGLGLSIVQRLVREARGALHVHSVLGRGTTFTIYVPAARMPQI